MAGDDTWGFTGGKAEVARPRIHSAMNISKMPETVSCQLDNSPCAIFSVCTGDDDAIVL